MGLSIVLPTYNERENIVTMINRVRDKCVRHNLNFEIVVIDDDSPDGTWKIVEDVFKTDSNVKLLRRIGKKGLASAIIDGINYTKNDSIVVMDSDLSHDLEIIDKMYHALQDCDIVIGSRYVKGGRIEGWTLKRKIISRGATLIAKLLLFRPEKDPLSGFFMIRKNAFEAVKELLKPKGYKILLELLVKGDFVVKEIPFTFRNRTKGKSKLTKGVMKEYLKMILELIIFKITNRLG